MVMWYIIMWTALVLTGAALVYVSNRVCQFECVKRLTGDSEKLKSMIGGGTVFGLFALVCIGLNFMNAIVCIIYFALSWLICDAVFAVVAKIRKQKFLRYYAGAAAIFLSLFSLAMGWYLDHNVWATHYVLKTSKNVSPLRIVMFADSHTGTTFRADGFARHIDAMQTYNPDVVIVAGDYVDDGTTREDMIETSKKLGKMQTKYGVYFVFGNHDNGYYGAAHRGFSGAELVAELEKNGVKVLRDETTLIADTYYLIGRRDASVEREQGGHRLNMQELTQDLETDKYMIVADHQPADYDNQTAAKVDLVLSGHTHGGQLFPFNQVGKWIGANDLVYGHEKRQYTDFVVTSGLSDWAIKFKTGTKSEYVIIDIKKAE
ncbi:MAG: metallophosphoesterase [Alphaproteobacteria bacterium]|nr:metallophosphoesterase [Alphaproteobacteria bacterium]